MTETAPSRQPRLTDVPSATPEADRARPGLGYVWRFWAVVVVFSAIVLVRSAAVGVPVRDPDGQMFQGRLTKALVLLVVIALLEAVVRAARGGWRPGKVVRHLRERWTGQRLLLVLTGLVGYTLVLEFATGPDADQPSSVSLSSRVSLRLPAL